MDLFIIRHGKAGQTVNGSNDAERGLTSEGKVEIIKIAKWMTSKKYRFDTIATSPLRRAIETAEIIASSLDQKDRLAVWDELAPGGDLNSVAIHAGQFGKDAAVLIVGHEPALSIFISRTISENDNASIALTKGSLAKIRNYSFDKRPSGELHWLLTPKQIINML